MYFTAWYDNKEVHMLSSYPVYIGSVERRSKNKEGNFEMLKLPRPSAVENYNKIMGGTDLGDQLGSYYRFEHQTTKWPHRIFTHFMMLAAVNAHILRNWTFPDFPITLKVFLEDLKDHDKIFTQLRIVVGVKVTEISGENCWSFRSQIWVFFTGVKGLKRNFLWGEKNGFQLSDFSQEFLTMVPQV